MPNSFTANLNLEKPEVGADSNLWGGHLNSDLDILDSIFTSATTRPQSTIIKSDTTIVDAANTTKKILLALSGISAGATRTLTVQDAAGTLAFTVDVAASTVGVATTGMVTSAIAASTVAVTNITNGVNTTAGPTIQSLTSGTGATYTTPANAKWLRIRAWGGGGGGAGAAASGSTLIAGNAGNDTIFNSIHAKGGGAAPGTVASGPTAGGIGGTGGSGAATLRIAGLPGGFGSSISSGNFTPSGAGGGPGGGINVTATGNGNAAAANSGGGGSGAYNSSGSFFNGGAGGGAGEYMEIIILSPAATYTYTVGASTTGGSSDSNGGAGGSGYILVEEHYNF